MRSRSCGTSGPLPRGQRAPRERAVDSRGTLLEAATLAPYEALLRTEREEALAILDWLATGGEHWPRGRRRASRWRNGS